MAIKTKVSFIIRRAYLFQLHQVELDKLHQVVVAVAVVQKWEAIKQLVAQN